MKGIEVEDLTVRYGGGEALHAARFSVPAGGTCAVIGPSGCGKSTLLKALAGLVRPDAGAARIGGQSASPSAQCIGYIPQNYGLLPWRTARENIALSAKVRRGAVDEAELAALVERLGLRGLEARYPAELSGGQRQRVGLGRVFLLRPDVLLLDEPFSALDAITREEMQDVFLAMHRAHAVTTVLVTHYVEEAVYLGQTIVMLSPGPGTVRRVVDNPLMGLAGVRQTEAFFARCRELRGWIQEASGHV